MKCIQYAFAWFDSACHLRLSALEATISSPQYPKPYARSTICDVHVDVPMDSMMEIKVKDMDVDCNGDFLEVKTNCKIYAT